MDIGFCLAFDSFSGKPLQLGSFTALEGASVSGLLYLEGMIALHLGSFTALEGASVLVPLYLEGMIAKLSCIINST